MLIHCLHGVDYFKNTKKKSVTGEPKISCALKLVQEDPRRDRRFVVHLRSKLCSCLCGPF